MIYYCSLAQDYNEQSRSLTASNCIEIEEYQAKLRKKERESLGLPETRFTIGIVSNARNALAMHPSKI